MKVKIERLGHRGDGIAAGPVYVPNSLPGELVDGEIVNGRIPAAKILTPSTDRVSAPCPHFKSCGGCALQHASDRFVAAWKKNVVKNALRAQSVEAPILGVKTSPPKSRRRATLSGRRTKKGAIVGFHARASATVIEVPNCQILHTDILNTIPALQKLTVLGTSRKGEISLSVSVANGGADVSVQGGKPLDLTLRQKLAALVADFGFARLSWDDEPVGQQCYGLQSVDGIEVSPPAGAFLQATKEGESALIGGVLTALGPAKMVVDLFAGCGTFALPLARQADVYAVESARDMLAALDAAWRKAAGLKTVKYEVRDLFRRPLLSQELQSFDAIVIDPPRAGAEAQAVEIGRSNVPRIAFVSCNPVTFARDAKILVAAGYSLNWIEVIDQFRWSPHVEIVAQFTKAPAY